MTQLVHIVNRVSNAAIRRERNGRGDLVYIVPSYTLPDDVVMNGGLYPAAEIAASYKTLEGTKAPLGHPYNDDGDYISADDNEAIDYFYVGAVNKNARQVPHPEYGNRIYVEKHINHAVAMTTERGRRLIEAIDAGEPIHTSTGVLLEPIPQEGEINGSSYEWVATNMQFDHDAILLEEDGAATPDDGVGMMVNHKLLREVRHSGQTMMVNTVRPNQKTKAPDPTKTPAQNQSMRDKEEKVRGAIQELMPDAEWKWLADWGEDYAIIEADENTYRVSYSENEDGQIEISGNPEPVRRVTTWEAIQNAAKRLFNRGHKPQTNREDDVMRDMIINALKAAGKEVEGKTDDELMAAYNEHVKGEAAEPTDTKGEQSQLSGELEVNADIQKLVADQVAAALKANKAEAEKSERDALAEKLKANGVEDISREEQDKLSVNSLQKLVDRTAPKRSSVGVRGGQIETNSKESSLADAQMPE